MKRKAVRSLLLLLLTALTGCKSETAVCDIDSEYVCLKHDPNSSQAFITAILPQLDAMNKQTRKLVSQHKWFRDSLNKCLRAIEVEKGLEPIPLSIKYPLPFKEGPNHINEYISKDEPLFMPYEGPNAISLGEPNNIHILKALLNLQILSANMSMANANDWIENFEKRLQRIEDHLEE